MGFLTLGLNWIFSNKSSIVTRIDGKGMGVLDKSKLLKQQLIKKAIVMIKIALIIFLTFINFSTLGRARKELREIIKKTYPELTIKSIQKTNYNDLYEIFIGGQIIYSDEEL